MPIDFLPPGIPVSVTLTGLRARSCAVAISANSVCSWLVSLSQPGTDLARFSFASSGVPDSGREIGIVRLFAGTSLIAVFAFRAMSVFAFRTLMPMF